jgi:N-acetyl-alpha-D-muramate 1-phosphate uridylyltransferase
VLTHDVLANYPDATALDLVSVYQALLDANDLAAYEVHERFFEIGTPAALEELRHHLAAVERHL